MHLLRKPIVSASIPVLPGHTSAQEIAQTVWRLSGNTTSIEQDEGEVVCRLARDRYASSNDDRAVGAAGLSIDVLTLDRENYQLATLPFLDPIIPIESHLLPSPIQFTTYIPAISNMVNIDDQLEKEDAVDAAEGRPRKNRKTGRMMRLTTNVSTAPTYVRQMTGSDEMGEIGLQAVRDCRLNFGIFEAEETPSGRSIIA
jgi:hypothetical protein